MKPDHSTCFGTRGRAGTLPALCFLLVVHLTACTTLDSTEPAPAVAALPKLVLPIYNNFSLSTYVDQSRLYTARFHLGQGQIRPTESGDSLRYEHITTDVKSYDSGSYEVCWGADCRQGVLVLKRF